MSNLNFRKRRNRRGFFFHLSRHLPTFIVLFVIALVLGGGIFAFSRFVLKKQPGDRPVFATASEATKSNGTPSASAEADPDDPIGQLIDQADRLAKGYDYDKAGSFHSVRSTDQRSPCFLPVPKGLSGSCRCKKCDPCIFPLSDHGHFQSI